MSEFPIEWLACLHPSLFLQSILLRGSLGSHVCHNWRHQCLLLLQQRLCCLGGLV